MVRLECTTGSHNKFYEFNLVRTNGHIKVLGYYGAIGQAPKQALIYDGDSEVEARKELDRKQNEKLRKGYVVVSGNGEKTTPLPQGSKKKTP